MFCVLFGAVRVAWRELILVAVRVIRDAVIVVCAVRATLTLISRRGRGRAMASGSGCQI